MSKTNCLRWVMPLVVVGALSPVTFAAQSQDSQTQSVAEAARKAREQKKNSAKPVPVITEDTLKPPSQAEKAVEAAGDAQAGANPAGAAAPGAAAKAATKTDSQKADDEKKKQAKAELEALKQQLASAKKSLDLLQRELALDQDTFLSNPYHDRDTAGKAKLDGLKQQISDKQQQIDVLNTRISALQELLGSDASAAPATGSSPPQS